MAKPPPPSACSACVAALGKKVLVVDLDPQGNTTSGMALQKKVEADTYTCLINDDDVREAIVHTKYNADLLASSTQLAGAPVELVCSCRGAKSACAASWPP